MKKNIYLISLGCPRNLVDSEILKGALVERGFRVIDEFRPDCIALVNTCGFIEDSKKEAVEILLQLAEYKKQNKISRIIVAGCLSQRYPGDIIKEIPEIDAVFGAGNFIEIPAYIDKIIKGESCLRVKKQPRFLYDHSMPRSIMTPPHSIYVKIQEGCMNYCSYCVIPKLRGPFRSRKIASVLDEIRIFYDKGAREINLVGQDTTLFGVDRYKEQKLAELLKKASGIIKNGWIRLLYTHPAHYTDDLLKAIKDAPSICKYLDLPIQHINDKILKKMNRGVAGKDIIKLIRKIRRRIPEVAIRTTVMVGFPGETESDFDELENFVRDTRFERLGVFPYSREEGTKAYNMPGQVTEREKKDRLKRIMELQKEISEEYNKNSLNKTLQVIVDEPDTDEKGLYLGRTQYDAPEVDGTVYIRSKRYLKKGDFINVKIDGVLEYDLLGEVTD